MKSVILTVILIFLAIAFFSHAQQSLAVTITQPLTSATVQQRHTVSGSVSHRQAKVWVVIHPVGTTAFWVQPPVSLNPDGTWSVLAYFGREGAIDRGNQYEVRAFANPGESLQSGERRNWPSAAAQSLGIIVIRQ